MKYRLLALLTALLLLNPAHGAEKSLTFIHVNDVYELQPRQGLGGVAFLATLLKEYRLQDPQLAFTFGGDLLSPEPVRKGFWPETSPRNHPAPRQSQDEPAPKQ